VISSPLSTSVCELILPLLFVAEYTYWMSRTDGTVMRVNWNSELWWAQENSNL